MDAAASGARGVAGRASACERQHMSRSKRFGGGSRGRQKRVVLAPVAGVKLMEILSGPTGLRRIVNSSATEAKGIRLREERAISRKTIAQGRPGVPAHLAVTRVHFVRTIAGAEGTRLSLRPLRFSRASPIASLRALRAARMWTRILTTVVTRLVRNCALGRVTQYSRDICA
jgi:hypothetical protein